MKEFRVLVSATNQVLRFKSMREFCDFAGVSRGLRPTTKRILKGKFVVDGHQEPITLKHSESGNVRHYGDIVYAANKLNVRLDQLRKLQRGEAVKIKGYELIETLNTKEDAKENHR